MKRILLYPLASLMLLLLLSPAAMADSPDKNQEKKGQGDDQSKKVQLQILALNDLHGNIASNFTFKFVY